MTKTKTVMFFLLSSDCGLFANSQKHVGMLIFTSPQSMENRSNDGIHVLKLIAILELDTEYRIGVHYSSRCFARTGFSFAIYPPLFNRKGWLKISSSSPKERFVLLSQEASHHGTLKLPTGGCKAIKHRHKTTLWTITGGFIRVPLDGP